MTKSELRERMFLEDEREMEKPKMKRKIEENTFKNKRIMKESLKMI